MQNNPWEPMLDETNKHYFEHKLRGRKLTPETEIRYREYILAGTIGEVYAGFFNEIDSLRNVVESQKEEIEKYRREAMNERELGESIVAEREQLYIEIESLKAITELAVKGLREIVKGDESYHTTIFEARDWIDKIEVIADTTLSEIERLSQ